MRTEDIRNMAKAYAAVLEKAKKEAMDPVNPGELKGKHKDRKDKDIDNDGDVDSTDQYLHKRRKAISKSKKETASKSATTVSKDNKTDTDVQTQEDTKEETIKTVIEGEMPPALKKALDKKKGKMNDDDEDDMDDEDEDEDDDDEKENGKKKKKEPVDEAGPKIDPAKMAAHMARNDKPKKMTSTQKSLASIRQRAEEVDLDESAASAAAAKRKMDQDRRDRDRSPVAKLLSPRERSEAEARARRERQAKPKREEVELDEISKDLAGRYIKKANINTADAADQNARKSSMGQKPSIGKVMKRFKGVSTAADKLTGKAKVPARESVEIDEAAKGTAQHKPDEKTRDTYEKQLSTRKGEKDFVDQHKAETPEAGDEPKVDALNFQKFKSMVSKKDNSRPADQKKGDNSIIPSATPVKQ